MGNDRSGVLKDHSTLLQNLSFGHGGTGRLVTSCAEPHLWEAAKPCHYRVSCHPLVPFHFSSGSDPASEKPLPRNLAMSNTPYGCALSTSLPIFAPPRTSPHKLFHSHRPSHVLIIPVFGDEEGDGTSRG
ncbi:hypothetical protein CEP53_012769 [Fusarium sp. AF-6]|nr:hypothetical protein CEP53_012769 [Fusarium sp. AF-6]